MNYNTLNNAELLGIILNCKEETIKEVAAPYNTVGEMLYHFTENDVLKVKGLGKSAVNKLNAMSALFERISIENKLLKNRHIESPKKVFKLLKDYYKYKEQEILILLTLDTKNNVTHIIDIFKGSINTSIVHPREIFHYAIKYNAASIIIVHQHPSGDPAPSREDINISNKIKEVGQIVGIKLIDSIIIGSKTYISLNEKGLI